MKALIGLFIPDDPPIHIELLEAFAEGVITEGENIECYPLSEGWQKCDISVTFGIRKRATMRGRQVSRIMEAQARCGGEHLVIEQGFIRREDYYMLGWWGLNGRAEFCNKEMPNDRADLLGIELKPWKYNGEAVIICGQIPWDASVQHIKYVDWCRKTALKLINTSVLPVYFRPHPLGREIFDLSETGVRLSERNTIEEELTRANCVVTFNSNSAVDALIAGVPVIAIDKGSMVWPVANHRISCVSNLLRLNRSQWLSNIAYAQWSMDEIRSGVAWIHLRKYLDKTRNIQKVLRRIEYAKSKTLQRFIK